MYSGYPQPEFKFGQKWSIGKDVYLVVHAKNYDVTFWKEDVGIKTLNTLNNSEICFNPSFQELWKALPKEIQHPKYYTEKIELTLSYLGGIHYNEHCNDEGDIQFYNHYDSNITEAAAKLWILLKEKQLI